MGDILSATFEKRQTSGAAAELQKHHGIGSHQVPLSMLRIDRGVEERAAATVPASNRRRLVKPRSSLRYSASGDGAFMGIERPTVATGDAAYPGAQYHPRAVKGPFTDSTEAVQTDAEFVATNLVTRKDCRRASAYRRTDAARFAGLRCCASAGLERRVAREA